MSAVSDQEMTPAQRERKAIKMLETRARGLEGARVMVAGFDQHKVDGVQGALEEAAAILRDAAAGCRNYEVKD